MTKALSNHKCNIGRKPAAKRGITEKRTATYSRVGITTSTDNRDEAKNGDGIISNQTTIIIILDFLAFSFAEEATTTTTTIQSNFW
jgi:hypothetical protein